MTIVLCIILLLCKILEILWMILMNEMKVLLLWLVILMY